MLGETSQYKVSIGKDRRAGIMDEFTNMSGKDEEWLEMEGWVNGMDIKNEEQVNNNYSLKRR